MLLSLHFMSSTTSSPLTKRQRTENGPPIRKSPLPELMVCEGDTFCPPQTEALKFIPESVCGVLSWCPLSPKDWTLINANRLDEASDDISGDQWQFKIYMPSFGEQRRCLRDLPKDLLNLEFVSLIHPITIRGDDSLCAAFFKHLICKFVKHSVDVMVYVVGLLRCKTEAEKGGFGLTKQNRVVIHFMHKVNTLFQRHSHAGSYLFLKRAMNEFEEAWNAMTIDSPSS